MLIKYRVYLLIQTIVIITKLTSDFFIKLTILLLANFYVNHFGISLIVIEKYRYIFIKFFGEIF